MALVKAYLSNCYNNRRENSYFVRVIGEEETTTYEFYDGSQLTVDEDETLTVLLPTGLMIKSIRRNHECFGKKII